MHDTAFFAEELGLIKEMGLQAMTEVALSEAPAWYWTEPASITGKHHPPDDLVEGGLLVHSKKVCWLAHRFFDAFGQNTDVGVSAALLHDIRHRGSRDQVGTSEDYHRHAQAAADYLREFGIEQASYGAKCGASWSRVTACIATHMGRYSAPWELPVGWKLDQQLFHLADVAASFRLLVGLPFYTDAIPPLEDIMDAGKYFIERNGVWLVNFGKRHFRQQVDTVMATNPGYFDWMLKAGFPDDVVAQVKEFQAEYERQTTEREF